MNKVNVKLGIENLVEDHLDVLKGRRIGLVCNQASVTHALQHSADLLFQHPDIKLTALFGPQHGIRGDVQDNMVESGHGTDPETGLPVFSLYSETRIPTEEMLSHIDAFVFDLQDVGCRIYTFIYTLANCMKAAAAAGKTVIVCDRPNPINGDEIEGNILEPAFASFVGQFPIPTRHGMTVAELGQFFNKRFNINCDLKVIPMSGWRRNYWMDDTDAPWVLPSPNMPTLDAATVFPGTVHFEGTQISEGRGTTRPFEFIGAPYIDGPKYAETLTSLDLPGVFFRPCGFQPTFQKHAGHTCGGLQIHVTNRDVFKPVRTGIAAVKVAYDLYTDRFAWKVPPYEYVYDKNPFDVICGTDKIRKQIERGDPLESIVEPWEQQRTEFAALREEYLLY
jgi:uncharacterized protein YbbC (DUF1343 family)